MCHGTGLPAAGSVVSALRSVLEAGPPPTWLPGSYRTRARCPAARPRHGAGLAPLALHFLDDSRATWHALLAGGALFGLGAAALYRQRAWEEAALCALGLWLLAAPFVLHFRMETAVWTHLLVGAAVALDAAWSLIVALTHPPGGARTA